MYIYKNIYIYIYRYVCVCLSVSLSLSLCGGREGVANQSQVDLAAATVCCAARYIMLNVLVHVIKKTAAAHPIQSKDADPEIALESLPVHYIKKGAIFSTGELLCKLSDGQTFR